MRFHFPQSDYLIIVNNTAHRGEEFCIEENDGYIIVNVLGENTNTNFCKQLFAVIGVKNGKVSVYGDLRLVEWGDDYDVCFTLSSQPFYQPPTAICQAEHRYGNNTFTATVYNDGKTRLLMETTGKTARFDLPDTTCHEINFQPTNLGFLAVITAKQNENKYLLLILYDNQFNKIFETVAEDIKYSARAFIVTESLNDMLGRKKISSYSFTGTTLNKPEVTFEYQHDKLYPEVLTPYLLLEALSAGDKQKIKTYLSDDLSEDADNLKEYFGDFSFIVCPKYKNFTKKDELLSLALIYDTDHAISKPHFYNFKMNAGKIVNISD